MINPSQIDLLEALPDAALIVDADGRVEHANAAAQALLGPLEWLRPDAAEARFAALRASVFASSGTLSTSTSTSMPLRWIARRRNGHEFPAELSLRRLPGEHAPRALALVRDASERQQLEQGLHDARRLQSEFFGHMSHELGTPLNGVIGFAEFLLEGKPGRLNETQQEYLRDILESGRRLQQLIEAVMELSQLEAGSAEMHSETFSFPAAIEEACAAVAAVAQQKGVGLHRTIAAELQLVSLDRRRLLQVLHYLLANAVKFSGSGRAICIEAAAQGESALRLRISDTGTSARSTALEQLLSDYPQLDASAIRRFGGSGLDLVLAKKIVEAQAGVFSVENDLHSGPAFCLILPCLRAFGAAVPATRTAIQG